MRLLPIALCLSLAGAAPPAPSANSPQAETRPSPACQMTGRGEWTAHVDAMPGPDARPTLIVTGALRVKPAARAMLRLDPAVMESDPPQYIVILDVRLPREPTIDMLERRQIRGEWPVSGRVGAVHIRCGGRPLATITDVTTAR